MYFIGSSQILFNFFIFLSSFHAQHGALTHDPEIYVLCSTDWYSQKPPTFILDKL